MTNQYDSLIFDMDGVLVNTTPAHARAFEDLWKKLGIKGPEYSKITGRKSADVVREYVTDLLQPKLDELVQFKQQRAREYMLSEAILFPDTLPALSALRRRYRLALGTAGSRETTDLVLKSAQLVGYFDLILTAEDVLEGKPSPEIYEKVLQRLNVVPEQSLIIEDSLSGLLSADAAQAFVACVRSGQRIDSPRFRGSYNDLHDLSLTLL